MPRKRFLAVMVGVSLLVFVGVLCLGISIAHADAVTMATSSVNTQVGRTGSDNWETIGPTEGPLSVSRTFDQVFNSPPFEYSAVANSSISVSFGPGVPEVGTISGVASASSSGYLTRTAAATAGGMLRYYFSIEALTAPPFTPSYIPVSFEASGQGTVASGYGMFDASVFVGFVPAGFPSNDFKIHWEGGPATATFNKSVTLNLPVNTQYQVQLAATAYASHSSLVSSGTSLVSVYVDPIIRFDQAAFNSLYGTASFRLSDYYALEFSPNLPVSNSVPEPSTLLLLGSGLVGLVGYSRRRMKK